MTKLLIVIVSYNTRDDLVACLESLRTSPPETDHAVVVVDNASNDGSVEAIRLRWPEIEVISLATNVGFARANNIGIQSRDSSLILLLNSDTKTPTGAIDTLVETLQARDDVAVAGPRLINEQGLIEISWGRMIGPITELLQKLVTRLHTHGVSIIRQHIEKKMQQEQSPDWVSGACLLVQRQDAEAVGLLDERFFMYGEDVDFCAAIRSRGKRILFTPAAEFIHLRGRSRVTAPEATERAYRQSQLAFYEKHHPQWLPILRIYLRLKGSLPEQ